MQTRYIVLQVLALFLLVLIRKSIRFDRAGDNPEKESVANNATSAAMLKGLAHGPREKEPSNHSG
ncbi:hypothetical protein [Geobacter sp. AOG2]|uniref:hypothetical protein n=1 Tax=Geobacter sp. AOG2 TaxID=1566347 RepID=UPI001CC69D24|nr:hypothetical protein [Geobacter sp. AOG2]GFE59945.1 hypothetical protein AOG2_05330 [Geobacter sp. AOG2]